MRPRSNRGGLPRPDSLGRWRPEVGRDKEGNRVRFFVGNKRDTTEAEALKRLNAIRDLYDRQCDELKRDFWDGWALGWARKLAQKVPVVIEASPQAIGTAGQASEELKLARQLQRWGMPVIITDNLPALGYASIRERIDTEVHQAVEAAVEESIARVKTRWGSELVEEVQQQTALPQDPTTAPRGTLHETIKVYKKHLEGTGKQDGQGNLSPHARKCLEWLDMLVAHHADCQLWQMDHDKIEAMVSYWKNRPKTKRSPHCSIEFASKMIQQLYRYLRWLDQQAKYRWSMPHGVERLKRTPNDLREDDERRPTAFRSVTKPTHTPQQLAVIAQFTDDFGRALIGVCANCAFGASEVGQWKTSGYHLFKSHPHAALVGIQSSDADSWIVGSRPKTGNYGEHLLWEEVAKAVQPFLAGREVLPVTGTGHPWYRSYSKNAQSHFQSWWEQLLDKVRMKHADIPKLPFGSLRDLLPNILAQEYPAEVASLCLQHGDWGDDDLLKCYANLPFKKLFEATRELRTMFEPFLDALTTQSSVG